MPEIQSRPYKPQACCEACVFGRGAHAAWCAEFRPIIYRLMNIVTTPGGNLQFRDLGTEKEA